MEFIKIIEVSAILFLCCFILTGIVLTFTDFKPDDDSIESHDNITDK